MKETITSLTPSEKEENSKDEKISRRDFLKKVAIVAGGTAYWTAIANSGPSIWTIDETIRKAEESAEALANKEEAKEFEKAIEKELPVIYQYRATLGLTNLPPKLFQEYEKDTLGFVRKEAWDKQKETENNIPLDQKSYGDVLNNILKIMGGKSSGYMINEIKTDTSFPKGIFFHNRGRILFIPADRYISLPVDIENYDISWTIGAMVHEATHGLDPDVAMDEKIPSIKLLQMESGKWRALAQAFEVDNEMFSYSRDYLLKQVYRNVGEEFGRLYTEGDDPSISFQGKSDPRELEVQLSSIAEYQSRTKENIIFDKRTCRSLGSLLVEYNRFNLLKLGDRLQEAYNSSMDNVMREFFADITTMAILEPDRVNTEIIEGVTQFLSALKDEEVDLNNVHNMIKAQNSKQFAVKRGVESALEEVGSIISDEPQFLENETNVLVQNTYSEKELSEHNDEVAETSTLETKFNEFMNNGKVDPEDIKLKPIKTVYEKYAQVCKEVSDKWPILKDYTIPSDNFDPPTHIWKTREVEDAINSIRIRDILSSPAMAAVHTQFMREATKTLEDFLSVEAPAVG